MLAQTGLGEWRFAALVEADSNKILFDAGGHERTVLENAKELNINLSNVPAVRIHPLMMGIPPVETTIFQKQQLFRGFIYIHS